jgi:hypothetical protein
VVLVAETAGWSERTDHSAEALNRLAVSFALVLSLWGTSRISEQLERLRLAEMVREEVPLERLFRGVDSIAIPLILTLGVGLLLPLDEAIGGDPVAAAIQFVTWLLIGLPLSTAVWVYTCVQVGLHRLGRGELTLDGYHGDRTLGLQQLGTLAFTGFWMLLGTLGPLALTGADDVPSVLVTTAVLVVGISLFFLSHMGLHRQMSAVRDHELRRARRLYEEAYRPVQEHSTLQRLQEQSGLLSAADNLERRAERIQAWPFDEGTFARAVTIASSAMATIIARLLLAPTGL